MDSAIQQYLRAAAAQHRDVEHIGPFLATFDPATEHPMLSYAIPDEGATPEPGDVEALGEAYRRRRRVPRLEYLPSLAPAAEAVLRAAGFMVEARLALMTCGPSDAVALPVPAGVELVAPKDDEQLRGGLAVANAAFGEGAGPSSAQVDRARSQVTAGGVALLARDAASGRPIGWGQATPARDGASELVGIAVDAAHRRRGIAGAITFQLARATLARGVQTAFLTPGDDGAGRVYARAGFVARSEMLHLRAPG